MTEYQILPVVVTTVHRGVFFGYTTIGEIEKCVTEKRICINNARFAIYWGTTKGIGQLCNSGPTKLSHIGDRIPTAWLVDVTGVFEVTEEAAVAWDSTP